jgi:hypothetical protein
MFCSYLYDLFHILLLPLQTYGVCVCVCARMYVCMYVRTYVRGPFAKFVDLQQCAAVKGEEGSDCYAKLWWG